MPSTEWGTAIETPIDCSARNSTNVVTAATTAAATAPMTRLRRLSPRRRVGTSTGASGGCASSPPRGEASIELSYSTARVAMRDSSFKPPPERRDWAWTAESTSGQNCHPGGAGGHKGSGPHPACGSHPGGIGHSGGGLNRDVFTEFRAPTPARQKKVRSRLACTFRAPLGHHRAPNPAPNRIGHRPTPATSRNSFEHPSTLDEIAIRASADSSQGHQ